MTGLKRVDSSPRIHYQRARDGVCDYTTTLETADGFDTYACMSPATGVHRSVIGGAMPVETEVCDEHEKTLQAIDLQRDTKLALLEAVRRWAQGKVGDAELRELATQDLKARTIRRRLDPGWKDE